jgi:hypothetical protein
MTIGSAVLVSLSGCAWTDGRIDGLSHVNTSSMWITTQLKVEIPQKETHEIMLFLASNTFGVFIMNSIRKCSVSSTTLVSLSLQIEKIQNGETSLHILLVMDLLKLFDSLQLI